MGKIRFALTISGAVSLGAYEAGVLAALLSAFGPLCEGPDPTVRLDAIGGASAGAITGLLAARTLTAGLDPVYVMEQAWVERDDVKNLLPGFTGAPFSMAALSSMANDLLDTDQSKLSPHHQAVPIELVMVLTALRGLSYRIVGPQDVIPATTFVDLVQLSLDHDTPTEALLTPRGASTVEVALASGANEMGFPAAKINRGAARRDYIARGITDFPQDGVLWYTDGGTLDNEPLGHTLDLVDTIDQANPGDFERVHLLVHPHVPGAPSPTAWANPDNPPTWVATLVRALQIMLAQSVYDDLRQVQKTNTRLSWLDQLDARLGPALDALAGPEREQLGASLAAVLGGIDTQREGLPGHRRQRDPTLTPGSGDPRGLLRAVVAEIAGLAEKDPVSVEVISPALVGGTPGGGSDSLLAGKAMADFGGFIDIRFRRSDFDLGYRSALAWLERGGLTRHGLDDADNQRALDAAHGARPPAPTGDVANWPAAKILRRHPLIALRLALRGMHVAVSALFTRRPQV